MVQDERREAETVKEVGGLWKALVWIGVGAFCGLAWIALYWMDGWDAVISGGTTMVLIAVFAALFWSGGDEQ